MKEFITVNFKWLLLLVIVILLFRRCGKGPQSAVTKTDTLKVIQSVSYEVIKKDTVYTPTPAQVIYQPVTITDTIREVYTPVSEGYDYNNETVYYQDTLNNKYGSAVVADTIYNNRIQRRGVKWNLSIPTVTKTVVLAVPKRTIFYVGGLLQGNEKTFFQYAGVSLGLKFRNDKYWGVSGSVGPNGTLYGIEFKIPVKFKN